MNAIKHLAGLALIIVIAVGSGCGDPDKSRLNKAMARFGTPMDAQRIALAIPPIPPELSFGYLSGASSLSWTSPGIPGLLHIEKTVVFTDNMSAPVSEIDKFECKDGLLEVKSIYGDNGKSLSDQVFTLAGQPLAKEKGQAMLKEALSAPIVIIPKPDSSNTPR
jgi:hypothetical protein